MLINQLRDRLAELKKKEAIAQTREQLLGEEKQKLLEEVEALYSIVKDLQLVPDEELTPDNLVGVIEELQEHMDKLLKKVTIPQELL